MNQTNEEKILDILASMSLRMDSMEQGLNARMDSLENAVLKTNIKLETEIIPKIEALGDGHVAILEQLVPTSRVDELEDRVKFLETMLRSMSEEIQQLKKAQ